MLQLWFVCNTLLWDMHLQLSTLQLSLGVVVLLLAGVVWIIMLGGAITIRSAKALLALFVFTIFSFIVATLGVCNDHLSKAILTLPILFFLVLVGLEVGSRSGTDDWLRLQRTASWCLIVALSALVLEIVVPSWFPHRESGVIGRLAGLFLEPSHVAFSLFPCIALLMSADNKKMRRSGTVAIIGLLLLSRSSTLITLFLAFIVYRSIT